MDCPRCGAQLRRRRLKSVGFQRCLSCSGAWYGADKLRILKNRAAHGDYRWIHIDLWKERRRFRAGKQERLACPKDGGDVVERKSRRGKVFFGCANYPDCDFVLWNRPVLEPCPKCGEKFLVEKITKRHGRQLICNNESCHYTRSEELATA